MHFLRSFGECFHSYTNRWFCLISEIVGKKCFKLKTKFPCNTSFYIKFLYPETILRSSCHTKVYHFLWVGNHLSFVKKMSKNMYESFNLSCVVAFITIPSTIHPFQAYLIFRFNFSSSTSTAKTPSRIFCLVGSMFSFLSLVPPSRA